MDHATTKDVLLFRSPLFPLTDLDGGSVLQRRPTNEEWAGMFRAAFQSAKQGWDVLACTRFSPTLLLAGDGRVFHITIMWSVLGNGVHCWTLSCEESIGCIGRLFLKHADHPSLVSIKGILDGFVKTNPSLFVDVKWVTQTDAMLLTSREHAHWAEQLFPKETDTPLMRLKAIPGEKKESRTNET